MKKISIAKLMVKRQTLRRLDAAALDQVAGGTSPEPRPKPSTACSVTGPYQCPSAAFACSARCR